MAFKTWRDYWIFEKSIKTELRYRISEESEVFLSEVFETSKSRINKIEKGALFWRAQIGHDWREEDGIEVPSPHGSDRMRPRKYQATEGRVNSKGIPCLYLATDKKTGSTRIRVGNFRMIWERW